MVKIQNYIINTKAITDITISEYNERKITIRYIGGDVLYLFFETQEERDDAVSKIYTKYLEN